MLACFTAAAGNCGYLRTRMLNAFVRLFKILPSACTSNATGEFVLSYFYTHERQSLPKEMTIMFYNGYNNHNNSI